MVEACETEVVAMTCGEHSLVREECERVGVDELAYLLYAVGVADEFLRRVDIHSIVACIFQRSAGNTHMHLSSTGLAKHLHDLEGCGSTDDRVIHKHYPLALDDGLDRGKLHLHTLLAKRLGRKDEGTAHVLALDESHLVWETAGLRITLGCRKAFHC